MYSNLDIYLEDKIHNVVDHLHEKKKELETLFTAEYFDFNDWYFAGGCIYSLWNNKEPKDYDLFCRNRKAINKLRKFFRQHNELEDIVTKNAISMGKFQFILKHVGEPEVEVALFDFKHNCYYYDYGGLHDLFGWDYLDSNKLEFNSERARNVLNIITRIPKFIERGMEISQKEILDILETGTKPTKYFRERRNIKKRRNGRSVY